ncbi:UDP-glucose--hexose-1-phosphate uridylyltransferase [Bifidobacterium eulemuris]|uniref:Galactose-1-phosphate uridylyltransferase n=1 Tax=Bifidobacterium eulemuris TaxID=1765219 RepID=A0A261G9D1_9BIFI|nr:UDP-glucose--hexose-1-phosphate uridylyltransferase [Bifidobacterium eulemuris]OZG68037.1 galactose-1-phosphate uridylyltransferase [Bifidobacterium eulemuris]QOL31885.1 UDP-glucose--hexose-1-phosphate uridylyltransferase [Bifidobacterium eulemuris]
MAEQDKLEPVYAGVDALVDYACDRLALDRRDADWTRNRIFELFDLSSYAPTGAVADGRSADELLGEFRAAAVEAGLFEAEEGPVWADIVMGILSANPSALQDRFLEVERDWGGMAAMRWLYDYCVANTYVKRAQLDANPRFDSHGLVVTINLAKPEFKDMKKAAAGNAVAGGYPQCTICHENEGFAGRNKRTLRTLPVELGDESWFWQFSPYGYFDQHGICVNTTHTPMHVDRDTFGMLLDFVDRFPGYFLGCNAALPRIGGSVLAHDHFQGGGELLPMHTAPVLRELRLDAFPDVAVEMLDWPGSAVRVVSKSRQSLIDVCDLIREGWVTYSNPELDIVCEGEDGRRSALSPSAIVTERGYEMSLIFRNNGVSEEYPDGIFHAHPEFYPVKQEPIGLIEAQGLFILPGRLVEQLGHIEDALAAGEGLPEAEREFTLEWDELTKQLDGSRDRDDIRAAIQDELGSVCYRILRNTAVFKTPELMFGFLASLGLHAA